MAARERAVATLAERTAAMTRALSRAVRIAIAGPVLVMLALLVATLLMISWLAPAQELDGDQ
jgi:hypothetical protein